MTAPAPDRTEALAGALSQELHLVAAWIADLRHRSLQPREPWPDTPATSDAWPFAELIHLPAVPDAAWLRVADLRTEAIAQAEALGLLVAERGGHRAGQWQLTAMHDVFAVRDRPASHPPFVFLGDDGTRLLDTVLAARPHGTVLDIGCGAGLATAGAARSAEHVHGIDIVSTCVDAARTSAQLNGVGQKVTITHDDLFDFQPPTPVDCIVANLPGVPIPPGLGYIPAGNGGDDGLTLTRHLLDRVPAWTLPHGDRSGRDPVLLMRLQTPGDPEGPFALHDLRTLAATAHLDISVVTDSRINVDVRDSLTTKYAAQTNPQISETDIAHTVRTHSRRLGMTHYYSSSVTARPGSGQLRHVDLAIHDQLSATLHIDPPRSPADTQQIAGSYYARLARLPMGFWELGHHRHVHGPPARIHDLLALVNDGHTPAEATRQVFAHEFTTAPTAALALYSTTGLLIETMMEESRTCRAWPSLPDPKAPHLGDA